MTGSPSFKEKSSHKGQQDTHRCGMPWKESLLQIIENATQILSSSQSTSWSVTYTDVVPMRLSGPFMPTFYNQQKPGFLIPRKSHMSVLLNPFSA